MNQHDSSRIGEALSHSGLSEAASPEEAEVVVLNTCSVREKAVQKLRSEVGRLARLKRRRPEAVVVVAGCVAQQEGERLLEAFSQIDVVVGPDHLAALPVLIRRAKEDGRRTVRTGFDAVAPAFLSARPAHCTPTAYVTIMKGCDERCSFCIVPTTRGPERFRPSGEVVREVARLVDLGAREVTLLGQTVNRYVDPSGRLPGPRSGNGPRRAGVESQFPELLRAVEQAAPELARLRYTSPHPRYLSESLIRAHAEIDVLAHHVHLPVQSGSDRVLRRMIRRYTAAEYVDRAESLRRAVPDLTLSTDVIVGVPGETRPDFEATLELVRRIGFVGVFGFRYSPRPGTAALRIGDDVPEVEKSARLAELFELSDSLQAGYLRSLVGTTQKVLVEGKGKGADYTGRTHRNEIAHFPCSRDPTGLLLDVTIEAAYGHSLRGVPVDLGPEPAPGLRSGAKRSLRVL